MLEHRGERGYGSPVHRHDAEDDTFFVLDGELRVDVDWQSRTAGAGAAAFLPGRLSHAFVVTSPQARVLTLHLPAGFDDFIGAAGTPATSTDTRPVDEAPPDPATLGELARSYGIEILGPTPAP